MSPYYILKILVHKELSVFIQLSCNLEGRHNKQLLTITRGITFLVFAVVLATRPI